MTDASEVFNAIYSAKDNNKYIAYSILLLLAEIFSFAIAAIIALFVVGLFFAASLSTLLASSASTPNISTLIDLLFGTILPAIILGIIVFIPLILILHLLIVIPLTYSLLQEALFSLGFKRRLPQSYFPFGQLVPLCKLYILSLVSYFFTWLDTRVLAIQLITYVEAILILLSYFLNMQSFLVPLLILFIFTLIPFIVAEFYAFTRLTFIPATYLTEADASEIGAISRSWEFTKGRVWELALLNSGILGGIFTLLQVVLRVLQNVPCVFFLVIILFALVSPIIGAVGYASIYRIMKKG